MTLADLECAINDGAHDAKTATNNGWLLPRVGTTEMELILKICAFVETCQGFDQYEICAFGKAFEVVPRTLAENPVPILLDLLDLPFESFAVAAGAPIFL